MFKATLATLVAPLLAGALLFAVIVWGTAMGAVSGWAVGLVLGDTLRFGMRAFHIEPMAPWELGAFLGFVGAFFRSSSTTVKAASTDKDEA